MIMANPWIGVGVTIFAWWFSTGLILLLVRLPRHMHVASLALFAILAAGAVWGIVSSSDNPGVNAVYCGFVCALLLWGWHEASFLMGIITGPRPKACPPHARGLARFGYATATLIYHEIALFITLVGIGLAVSAGANHMALWTFGVLFVMRLSSKFNIFLGVPNLTDEFFPPHLEHLKSYLPRKAMNPLMPLSIIGSLCLGYFVWQRFDAVPPGSADHLALVMIVTLVGLGLLEHLFMITPLPDAALWRWAVPLPRKPDTATHANTTARDEHSNV
jgi:putative photosynthetic complex assembly protein 2